MITIPVFIVVKANNEENFNNNKELLLYAYDYIYKQQILRQTIVISDSQEMLDYASNIGFKFTYLERCKKCHTCNIEYNGIYHYLLDHPEIKYDWFILYNIYQPFKGKNMILDSIIAINDNYDFITTYTYVYDRSAYYITDKNKFVNEDNTSRVDLIPQKVKMIDNSILCIKTKYFLNAIENGYIAKDLWKGKFKTIYNKALYVPIGDNDDIHQLDIAEKIFRDIQIRKEES